MKMTRASIIRMIEKIEREKALDVKIEIALIDYDTNECIKTIKLHDKKKSKTVFRVVI